jgi:transposase
MPLTVPEVRRLVRAMAESDERRDFRFGWSRWRRRHQAVAARCQVARRAITRDERSPTVAILPPAAAHSVLTDAEWEAARPFLPPQKPRTGRPRHDHRAILTGILAVKRSDCSWREMPVEYGKWETAYKRYLLWREEGRWQWMLAVLGNEERERREVSL